MSCALVYGGRILEHVLYSDLARLVAQIQLALNHLCQGDARPVIGYCIYD